MRTSFLLCSLFASVVCGEVLDPEAARDLHKQWMVEHDKVYTSEKEELKRFSVFEQNLRFIEEHNAKFAAGEESYEMGLNQHADLTFREYSRLLSFVESDVHHRDSEMYLGLHDYSTPNVRGAPVPDTVNWVTAGAVTAVKDQGQCGSCWSFASTGSIEGAYYLAKKVLTPLSEEQLINCVNRGQFDCNTGGDMKEAFKYVIKNKGLVSEAKYPYKAADHQKCTYKPFSGKGTSPYSATITGYKSVATNNEAALKSAAAAQPIAVAIDASHQSFQFYKSGVYDEKDCCTNCQMSDLDHGVLVVGYGTENGKDYWLVKNSWNTSWGDKGYIKMRRNDSGRCGVPTAAVYPTV